MCCQGFEQLLEENTGAFHRGHRPSQVVSNSKRPSVGSALPARSHPCAGARGFTDVVEPCRGEILHQQTILTRLFWGLSWRRVQFNLNLHPKSALKELHFQETWVTKMMVINVME